MIPLRLRLSNFMSYAELEWDLSGLHCACLSGANGAGKSSLLDAITYVLWDKGRAAPEQLIRLGESEMWVELEFALAGETYRVWRRRTRKARGTAQLELHQRVEASEASETRWVSLTGTTMRETQARISQVVRMAFETFVHSAFFQQGQADAFTTKTPRERKAVLADVLGLAAYDGLAQKARERWKAAAQRAETLAETQARLRERLAERDRVRAELEAAALGLEDLALRLERARERERRLEAEHATLQALEAEHKGWTLALAEAEAALAAAASERAALAATLEAAAQALAERDAWEARYREWEAAYAAEEAFRAPQAHAGALDAERRAHEAAWASERHRHALAEQAHEAEARAIEAERGRLAPILKERARTEIGLAAWEAAREAEARHRSDEAEAAPWLARLAELDRAREARKLAWEAARAEARARLAGWRAELAAQPALAAEQQALAARLARFGRRTVELEHLKEKGFALRARQESGESELTRLRAALQALDAKLAQWALAPAACGEALPPEAAPEAAIIFEPGPPHACPLCETPLSEGELAKLRAGYEREREALEQEVAALEHAGSALEAELVASRARYRKLSAELVGREEAQHRAGELDARLAALAALAERAAALAASLEAERAAPSEPAEEAERARVEAALAALAWDPAEAAVLQARLHDYRWAETKGAQLAQALEAEAALVEREAALAASRSAEAERHASEARASEAEASALSARERENGYDPAAHAAARARLEGLADAPRAWREGQERLLSLASASARSAALEAEAAQQALRAREAEGALAGLESRLARLDLLGGERAAVAVELAHLRDMERQRTLERGRAEAALAQIAALDDELARAQAERTAALLDAQAHKELATAFGKDGIQALLIEQAIPEIENEANRLLARLSDNRMHVRLATQKEKKSGGVHETLEIHIADEIGTRPYELYSGGEAFRVNFALRLALSRLLARRAGAQLQTLVIDEGFGTQDEHGRERLIGCIQAVSDEFARILVVTHIRELKDAFTTHLEVVKRAGLSELHLVS